MKILKAISMLIGILFLNGTQSLQERLARLEHELHELTQRGITYRFLDATTIEIKEEWAGFTRVKTLNEPSEAEIRAWASSRGIPILEIDPNTIDTTQYSGWYSYWSQILLSNGMGIPLVVADFNRNGNPEVYGIYLFHSFSDRQGRIYEIDSSSGAVRFLHQYTTYPGVCEEVVDVDRNSLKEVMFSGGDYGIGNKVVFEQLSLDSLPTDLTLVYSTYAMQISPGYTGRFIGVLDQDSLTDFLYEGTWRDSIDTTVTVVGTAVAEFDYALNNFRRVWQRQEDPQYGRYGFSAGYFDADSLMEFVQSNSVGWVTVSENVGDNNYVQVWQENIPFTNTSYHLSGDIDNDGSPDFYVGATMSTGNWTIMFEADSNNHYSAKFIFHLLSGGTLDQPVYLATDVDRDSALELVIVSGRDLYVFKDKGDNDYGLWYFNREDRRDGVQFYDLNGDGRQDFLISKRTVDSLGRSVYYTDVYRANPPVRVPEIHALPLQMMLEQNHPNPFNPVTTIEYEIPLRQGVRLTIYNVLGQEVAVLVDEERPIGRHEVRWDASSFPSGVYIYRLSTQTSSFSRKMLLLK